MHRFNNQVQGSRFKVQGSRFRVQGKIISEQATTPRQFIAYADKCFSEADLFYGHGTDNSYDEAVYLVLVALGLPFDCEESELDRPLAEQEQQHLHSLIDKRIQKHVPVAYLVNEAWFCGLPFYVDERVLIPRSPVAELIEDRFSPWVEEVVVRRILDIGTGSACIAVASAYAFLHANIDAIDIDPGALEVAAINIQRHGMDGRVRLLQSDLYENLQNEKYDLIIANPPYVSVGEVSGLPLEYSHEPISALQAEKNGLAVVDRILHQSRRHLNEKGVLIIEVGNNQSNAEETYPDLPFIWLDFEHGGHGVFLLNASDLKNYFAR